MVYIKIIKKPNPIESCSPKKVQHCELRSSGRVPMAGYRVDGVGTGLCYQRTVCTNLVTSLENKIKKRKVNIIVVQHT